MADYTLTLFPENTLAASVTTTVWIGVWVVVFFNLRLGWSASGLVVPGYLVPLLIARPTSAAVILLESVITYLIVRLISERPGSRRRWSSLFGRDRFFAIVLVSVLVRAVMDGWLLPWLGPQLGEIFGLSVDCRNQLHSYGLIIVALTANYFWKPGLLRGAGPLAVTVAVTYLLVRYVLIELTNFNVGSLQYMYEDIASSLLASPKAYVILITTALIASRMNLRYGWEFNGILLPALLALQWYDPLKILASLGEAAVIYFAGGMILRLPLFRRASVQGSRKVLLFFNVSFAYRLLLGWLVPVLLPGMKVTDLYGFGYLLSTLLAIRAHDQNLAVRLARVSVQVSILGAVAGSAVGFLLTLVPGVWLLPAASARPATVEGPRSIDAELVEVVRRDKLLLYQNRAPESFSAPSAGELQRFRDALRRLQQYAHRRQPELLATARARLYDANYAVHVVADRYLYLRQQSPPQGWGLYVLDLENPDGLVVEVPAPLDEWATLEAGLCLFERLEGGALAIAGAGRRTNRDGAADVLAHRGTPFAAFHQIIGRGNTLQVRGYSRYNLPSLSPHATHDPHASHNPDAESVPSSLWIKAALPQRLSPSALKELIGGYQIRWQPAPLSNVLRSGSWSGFGELFLSRPDRRKLLAKLTVASSAGATGARLDRVEGRLRTQLLDAKAHVADRGTDLYVPARQEELLFLDDEVLKPLLRIARRVGSAGQLGRNDRQELQAAAAAAAVLDYRLTLFEDRSAGRDYLLLAESGQPPNGRTPPRRHWGTYAFRLGLADPYVVEVPRPLYERHVYEYGVTLFERVPAAAILIAGAHPRANLDGSADVVRMANKLSAFNLVHQVLLRELGPRPTLIVQARAIREPLMTDVVIATADGTARAEELTPLKRKLLDVFRRDGLKCQFADGSAEIAGYELGVTLQSASLNLTQNKELVSVWLSPSLRTMYRCQDENRLQHSQFSALGIPSIDADLYDYLAGHLAGHLAAAGPQPTQCELPEQLTRDLTAYLHNRDVVGLRKLQRQWSDFRLTRLIDRDSRQAFLLISRRAGPQLPAVVNLAQPVGPELTAVVGRGLSREQVWRFIDSRATWLQLRHEP